MPRNPPSRPPSRAAKFCPGASAGEPACTSLYPPYLLHLLYLPYPPYPPYLPYLLYPSSPPPCRVYPFQSSNTACAASNPFIPVKPPPGCVPALARYSPASGDRYRAHPSVGLASHD
jgi:hypothetical protein